LLCGNKAEIDLCELFDNYCFGVGSPQSEHSDDGYGNEFGQFHIFSLLII
jgi:hypothetical protein